MALKVAELFAELGIDAGEMERDADRVITATSRDMRRIVEAAEKAGTDAGRSLADGLEASLDRSGDIVTPESLYTSRSDFDRAGRQLGDDVKSGVRSSLDGEKLVSADSVRSSRADFEQAGREVGQSAGGGILDGMPDLSGGMEGILGDALDGLPAAAAGPALAAGAAIGAAMVMGIQDALANEAINDALSARLDVSARQSEEFSRVTSSVYRDAWGDSTQQVADAIDSVYSTLGDSRQGEESLQRLTEKALTFADVFQTDIDRAVSNAGVLISSGLAKDADEAFDLMVTGMQQVPRFVRDELQDAIQEYSVFFADLGYSGEEAMAMLIESADRGTYAIDKTGDAIKELSLRAGNLDDTGAMDALLRLGFDAEDMANRVATGGETAKVATQEIIAALDSVKDPAAQFAIATALMGGPIEDLGRQGAPELIAALQGMQGEMVDATGAADDLADAYGNTSTAVTTIRRELEFLFSDFANRRLAPLADLLEDEDKSLADYGRAAADTVIDAMRAQFVGGIGQYLIPEDWWDKYGPVASFEAAMRGDWFGSGVDEASEVGLATGAAFAQGAREGARGGPPLLDLDALTASAGPAKASLEDINTEIELAGDLFDLAADRAGKYLDRIASSSGLDDMLSTTLDLADATRDASQWIGDLSKRVDVSDIANGITKPAEDTAAVLQEWIDVGSKAQGVIAGVLQFQGADAASDRAGQIRDQLVGMMDAAGYTQEQITELLEVMGLSDWQIEAAVTLSGVDEALAKLDLLQARFDGEVPEPIQAQIDIALAEGRFEDAANLLSMWVKDREDGLLEDPLLVAIMANTDPATGEIETWKAGEEGKPGPDVPVDADTTPGQAQIDAWRRRLAEQDPARVKVALEFITKGLPALPIFGRYLPSTDSGIPGGFDNKPRRAMGGPVVGPGGPTADQVPLMASNGEWVIQASAVDALGPRAMAMVNSGQLPAIPVPAGDVAASAGGTSDRALLEELRAIKANLDRPNVSLTAPIQTTASAEENLRLIELRGEQALAVAGAGR